MQTKRTVVGAIIVLAGLLIIFLTRDDSNPDALERLSRLENQERIAAASQELDQPAEMIRLTPKLVAARIEEAPRDWLVESESSTTYVRLPFEPTGGGQLPTEPASEEDDSFDPAATGNPGYLGADACAECHQDRHSSFALTAHHRTSGLVASDHPIGHFDGPLNVLETPDEKLQFNMRKRDGRFYQQVQLSDWKLEFPHDVFTGSAKAGQTFLYWHDDALFQAHVSYLTKADEWVASPGYRETGVTFARNIHLECLECHMTYIDRKQKPNVYHQDSAIWGISCERCHGPGREHAEYHRQHPDDKTGMHIIDPSDLSRDRQIEVCGQCHSGAFTFLQDAFTYRAGEDLNKHHRLIDENFSGVGGIHTANQLKRLELSKCFRESDMTCTTCHNPHEEQRGKLEVFTASCLECHQPAACGMSDELGERISDNCISCHMPTSENEAVTLRTTGGAFSVQMVDHYIRVNRDATKAYLESQ